MGSESKAHTDVELKESLLINNATTDGKTVKPFKRKLVWTNVAVYVIGHIIGLWGTKIWLCDVTWTYTILGKC